MNEDKPRIPIDEIELTHRMIEPTWNDGPIHSEVKDALGEYSSVLKFQTRDTRISNLDGQGFREARWWHDLGTDIAMFSHKLVVRRFYEPEEEGGEPDYEDTLIRKISFPKSITTCIDRRDTILNLSQSKKGWRVEQLGTFTQRHIGSEEPKEKKLISKE